MVILHNLKAIFVHIPRTGGTSLTRQFREMFPGADVKFGALDTHSPYRFVKERFPNYRAFTVIRSPWEILQSMHAWCRDLMADRQKIDDSDPQTVKFAALVSNGTILDFAKYATSLQFVWAPGFYHTYIDDDAVRVFQFGEHVFESVSDFLGVEIPSAKHNSAICKKEEFTPEFIREVSELCSDDIQRFGYVAPEV